VILTHVVRKSSTSAPKPPEGAIVLFDGKNADEWKGGKLVEGDLLKMGTTSKRAVQRTASCTRVPAAVHAEVRGQGRATAASRPEPLEVQVLDSFGPGGQEQRYAEAFTPDGPSVNVCYPPLSWQNLRHRVHRAEVRQGRQAHRAGGHHRVAQRPSRSTTSWS